MVAGGLDLPRIRLRLAQVLTVIRDWLIVGFVFAVLWIFWLWLGFVFDAITEWHAALKQDGEASKAAKGKVPFS